MHPTKKLGLFSLVMITVGSVDSIRNLPSTAMFGEKLIFFFGCAAIFFLIPAALIAAELSASCRGDEGVYCWIKEAFGTKMGFFAVWLQWLENVIWYPAILSFIVSNIIYLIDPKYIHDQFLLSVGIVSVFWIITIINLFGFRISALVSAISTLGGLILPMSLIIGLGCYWYLSGNPLAIEFSWGNLLPKFNKIDPFTALTGIMMSCCGIELAAVHVRDINNPKTTFPKAVFYSTIIIITTLILGSLSLAIVVPAKEISLVAGIMQGFDKFLHAYGFGKFLGLIALAIVIGGIGTVNNWLIAPIRGLLYATQESKILPNLQRQNKYGAPYMLLITQAIIVSLSAVILYILPVGGFYWLFTAMASQIYMIMYILMFAAGIYLRYKNNNKVVAFSITKSKIGTYLTATIGMLSCSGAFAIAFFAPESLNVDLQTYRTLLLLGIVFLSIPPLVFLKKHKSFFSF